ncbi:DUF995 domain-containing protein [Mesorhizobium sp. M2A.F.Ca.ET.037.01.1.1]|uniref:DUF995 domain-containing protein n=2 Tax=unclassified Mesorhizobium TaxID=325217 RepID=UPI000F759ACB|nr:MULTISPECIES: DUF995 domain-containing protein [unclassified Mesorhizobium]RUX92478.1 DUF995 domain-containing protein [Mesorhizobium sp. M2A.F.Ca.ET.040.01.1.1]RVC66542.1 DUF995 domain-containing protein [Mesorhizobium sp. M2A.F.Ca.ET.046.02.1.1]RVC69082.1 DUF995 domain-containing protein [Mesorhizobium sp. M00.F.Ca.ET.038.03.1.1]RWX70032.1 DUF995 domain-containing protein [Mesorhizobium sp. M2A.F.Ca.ET.039.01.1.1]AZO33290.1 DUF995 domain-containing protein [Mesorhizobium sp. M2A.F.Ca.ET.0
MKSAVGKFVGAALVCSVFVIGLQDAAMAKAANRIGDKAAKATAVSEEGIYQLYKNRSWRWGNHGAAFFAVSKRQFTAWSTEDKPSDGEGIWFMPGSGKLCFRATWRGSWGAKTSLSCFEHRQAGKVIYQRRSPSGDWYEFRDRRGKSDLRNGDYASKKVKRFKAGL